MIKDEWLSAITIALIAIAFFGVGFSYGSKIKSLGAQELYNWFKSGKCVVEVTDDGQRKIWCE